MFRRILIAIDGSEPAAGALAMGGEWAARFRSSVRLVHVVELMAPPPPQGEFNVVTVEAEMMAGGRTLLAEALAKLPADSEATADLRWGDPPSEIVKSAHEAGADLIVIGTHGRKGLPRLALGSTAEGVLRRATCPVLVVRG